MCLVLILKLNFSVVLPCKKLCVFPTLNSLSHQTEVRYSIDIECQINIRYSDFVKNSIRKIVYGFEFECHSGRFSYLKIEYPPD